MTTGACLAVVMALGLLPSGAAGEEPAPVEHTYARPGGTELKAYVFAPPGGQGPGSRPAIAFFHGGGWSMGEAAWAFGAARHYAEKGLVAVAVQYRLSDQESITPLEAMADTRAAIRWMRAEREMLGIDPDRIAAYGWSAGGHLAAAAALFDDPGEAVSAAPNALVLVSPAVWLERDGWVRRLLGDRAAPRDISPATHVRPGLPPTLVLQGDVDTLTPLAGARRFCDAMEAAGNACTLKVYEGYGHLFTPAGTRDDDWPKPDPETRAAALAEADRFLEKLGFIR